MTTCALWVRRSRWLLSAEPDREVEGGLVETMPTCGLEEALLKLYEQSGDAKYRDFCESARKLADLDLPIVLGRWGNIAGHAYAYLCRCLAQLRLNALDADPRLLAQSKVALAFLGSGDGLAISGACGDHECWHDTQAGTTNLGETCTTAYLIRWLDELLRQQGDARYGDVMERAIHNALFAAQSPDGRRLRYYAPFEAPRSYFDKDTYCCPCNYRRIIAELPGMVAYGTETGVAVNLYTASTVEVALAGGTVLRLVQETDYPNSGDVSIRIHPGMPAAFTLKLRIPRWSEDVEVRVNGVAAEGDALPGAFFRIAREWSDGDTVVLRMPMPWRLVKGRKAQTGRVAVMRGPLVFVLDPARHKELDKADLRLLTLDPTSLEGPFPDDSVRPDGLSCRAKAWGVGEWYPFSEPSIALTLTEFADPGAEAAYFHVPNPNDPALGDDELHGLFP